MALNLIPKNRKETLTLAVVFVGVLVLTALAVYFIAGSRGSRTEMPGGSPAAAGEQRSPATVGNSDDENFVDRLFGTGQGRERIDNARSVGSVAVISSRLLLASLLGAALALRPRKRILALKRNPYVSQTQILLAIVAAALMIIVGDNAARAFGIFAAVSLVRFRTNIRDPKEITVLLISLALGLASGVGRWDLALILAVFSLLVLSILEWREPQLVYRSLEVKVVTRNVASTQRALRQVFKRHGFDSELRALDGGGEKGIGNIVYSVDVSPTVTTDDLSEEVLELDDKNVDGIEWDQKKSHSYLYQ